MKASALAAVVVALLLAGCGLSGGETVVKYDRGNTARMTTAPSDGTYGLYSTTDRTPKVVHKLEQGDPLGFREEDGQIIAVAGEHEESIEPGLLSHTWYWKRRAAD